MKSTGILRARDDDDGDVEDNVNVDHVEHKAIVL